MRSILSSIVLTTVLMFVSSIYAAETGGKDSAPSKVVTKFLAAIRAGNATGMKDGLAKVVGSEKQQGLDRWVELMAKTGPRLDEETLRPVTDSRVVGEFAVVRGGVGPKPYMRLRNQDGAWKVLSPGEAREAYGLSAVQALNLSSLEKWADREWATPATAPAAAAVEPDRSAATGLPNRPAASRASPSPTTGADPARADRKVNPAIAEVVPILLREMATLKSPMSEHDRAMEILLQASDVASATQLLKQYPKSGDNLQQAGEIIATLPGGMNAPAAKELLTLVHARGMQTGTIYGLAIGYARAGDVKKAMAAMEPFDSSGDERTTLGKILRIRPEKEYAAAMAQRMNMKDPREMDVLPLAYAHAALGQEQELERLLQDFKASKEAGRFRDGLEKAEVAAFHGRLRREEIDKAREFADARFERMMAAAPQAPEERVAKAAAEQGRLDLYRAIIAARAYRGDLDGILSDFERVKNVYGAGNLKLATAYVHAKKGDIAAAEKPFVGEIPKPGENRVLHAIGLGMVACGAFDSGNADAATQAGERAAQQAERLTSPAEKVLFVTQFLNGAVRGPEGPAYIFGTAGADSFFLR